MPNEQNNEDSIDKVGKARKLEMLFTSMNFSQIAQEIDSNDNLFAVEYEDDFRQNFEASPFKDSPAILLRMTYDAIEKEGEIPTEEELLKHLVEKGVVSRDAFETDLYEYFPETYRAVMWLAGVMRAEQIGRVMVARLNAGGTVGAHKDYGPYHDHYDRFHICISGSGCHFRCGKETVKMMPGEVWWFYNNDEHEVHNDSGDHRHHIIVDLKLRGDKNLLRNGGDVIPSPPVVN